MKPSFIGDSTSVKKIPIVHVHFLLSNLENFHLTGLGLGVPTQDVVRRVEQKHLSSQILSQCPERGHPNVRSRSQVGTIFELGRKTYAQRTLPDDAPARCAWSLHEVLIRSLRPSVLVRLQGSVHSLALSHH